MEEVNAWQGTGRTAGGRSTHISPQTTRPIRVRDLVSYGDKAGHTTLVYNPVEGVGPVVNLTGSHKSGGAPTVPPPRKS